MWVRLLLQSKVGHCPEISSSRALVSLKLFVFTLLLPRCYLSPCQTGLSEIVNVATV
jgi:hypothetical protein